MPNETIGPGEARVWERLDIHGAALAAASERAAVHEAVCAARYVKVEERLRMLTWVLAALVLLELAGPAQALNLILHALGIR